MHITSHVSANLKIKIERLDSGWENPTKERDATTTAKNFSPAHLILAVGPLFEAQEDHLALVDEVDQLDALPPVGEHDGDVLTRHLPRTSCNKMAAFKCSFVFSMSNFDRHSIEM